MRILAIADLHVGCLPDTDYFLRVTTDIFDRELNLKRTDAVIFLGDFFDRLFKANDEYVGLAIDIVTYLVTLCRKNKIKLRFIYGTESHEMSQYQLFKYYLGRSDVDVKVIETVTEEELFPGTKVLYLPEEYVTDKAKFYRKYLTGEKRYDYIFGHGIIEEGWPTPLTASASEGKEKHVPRFKSKELLSVGDLVLFGHYHVHNDFYLGSLFRWKFGEEEPKGYAAIEDGKLTFVENTEAYRYRTYEFSTDDEIFSGVDKLTEKLTEIEAENRDIFSGETAGKVRLKLQLPPDLDPSFTEVLNKTVARDKSLTVTAATKVKTLNDEIADTVEVQYDFILDKSLPIEEKIKRYIAAEYPDSGLDIDDVRRLIGLD